jgi:hypothetical protein
MSTPSPACSASRLAAIETVLADLIPRLAPAPNPRGRPEIVPGVLLWTGLLVCLLRQTGSQLALWRLLSQSGLWHFPRIPVTAEAIRIRLERSGPAIMQNLFVDVTAELARTWPGDATLAPFATGVYALDESTLDTIARTLPTLRTVPVGDVRLLPGKLCTAFDLRTQRFATVQTTDLPRQNVRVAARGLLATLPAGSLIVADLGYFGFRWFDDLTEGGYYFISKCRQKTSCEVVHVLAQRMTPHGPVRDELVWLGAHRADRAKHLVRRVTVPVGRTPQVYLTNMLDPGVLPIAEVVRIYARRWDIEAAFKLVKRELGLHLLWSAKWELILTQLWGVLLLAQIASALRTEVARRAGIDPAAVSLTLLLRDLPLLVRDHGPDTLDRLATLPVVRGGYLRPSRVAVRTVPDPGPVTPPPPDLVTVRAPRYAGRNCGPNGIEQRLQYGR